MQPQDLIARLQSPTAYPFPVEGPIEVIETHISLVLLVADRVYKVKKPIRTEFLDYSTPQLRRHWCEEEVRLNRRLAGDTYRGVATLHDEGAGGLRFGGSGPVVDYAVEMRRLPAERMLDHLLSQGVVDNDLLGRLVDTLVGFHTQAASGPEIARYARPAALLGNWQQLWRSLEEASTRTSHALPPFLGTALDCYSRSMIDAHGDLLQERCLRNRVREGHGDLHAGNVCVFPDRFVIYDCIEFSPALRCLDVAAEIAFLAMDLDQRGLRGFGRYVVHEYAGRTEDDAFSTLIPLYKTYYAWVRGMVALMSGSTDLAHRYLHLGLTYPVEPALMVLCGLPGTGKSWLAQRLAPAFEASVVRSDVVRKHLVPAAAGTTPYSAEEKERTYRKMLDQARHNLDSGRSVIADANFPEPCWRERFTALAAERRIPFLVVHCTAAEQVVQQRLVERSESADNVSDADFAVYRKLRESFQPPAEIPAANRLTYQAAAMEEFEGEVMAALWRQAGLLPADGGAS